jgi:cysteinyl-tRNA synthetase
MSLIQDLTDVEAQLARMRAKIEVTQQRAFKLAEALVAFRTEARAQGQYALADRFRDALTDCGVEVHDHIGSSGFSDWSWKP